MECVVCQHFPYACRFIPGGAHMDPATALWSVLWGASEASRQRHGAGAIVLWGVNANMHVTRVRPSSAAWVH